MSIYKNNKKDSILKNRAIKVIPGGMYGHQNSSNLPDGYPQFMESGKGCKIWDVDGNEYIDLMCSYGPIILGHCHHKVEEAAVRQQNLGDCQNGPSKHMVELAEKLENIVKHCNWVIFAKNGTDSTTICLMIARAASKNDKVLVAKGAYHGSNTWCTPIKTGTTLEERKNIVEFIFNDLDSVDEAIHKSNNQIAAILVSPFRHDSGFDQELVDPIFAKGLRERCDAIGAALILDDVRCGFRLNYGSSWEPLGVLPDLSAWSKAIANGYPIAVVTGKEYLRKHASEIYVTGSFWFSAVAMAAACATLEALYQENSISKMEKAGRLLRDGLSQQAENYGIKIKQTGPVQMPYLSFENDSDYHKINLFCTEAIKRGAFLHPKHNWFVSSSHTESDINDVLRITEYSFQRIYENFR